MTTFRFGQPWWRVFPVALLGLIVASTGLAAGPDGLIEIKGRVVDPEGRAVAGARVRASTRAPSAEVTTSTDGRFRLMAAPLEPWIRPVEGMGYPPVAAWAAGFGLGYVRDGFHPGPSGELTIRLGEEGPPIEGRILDLEGRAVAGAKVEVRAIFAGEPSAFASWLERAKVRGVENPGRSLAGLTPSIATETDADGRFRLVGLGRDRLVSLAVSGPTIATTRLDVLAYDGPAVQPSRTPGPRGNSPPPPAYLAARFEAVAGPTRPIEGVITDKDTGRGIEGLRVRASVAEPRLLAASAAEDVQTDAEGRYRLLGMPAAKAYNLVVDPTSVPPTPIKPYVAAQGRTRDDPRALGPVRFDLALKQAVVVRGRVTDKATGRPVPGFVDPHVFLDNPILPEFPDYASTLPRPRTDDDGRFAVVTLPGRGILGFQADRDDYVLGQGSEAIPGFDAERASYLTRGNGCRPSSYHVLAAIDLPAGADSAEVNLQVDPGRSVELAVVDPEGRPAQGLQVYVWPAPQARPLTSVSSPLTIGGLDLSRPRRVTAYLPGRKLVGSIWLKGDEVGPLTVPLVPWGTVVGRAVDATGTPLSGRRANLVGGITWPASPTEGPWRPGPANTLPSTNKEGRFQIDELIPGLEYSATFGNLRGDAGFQGVVVAPGEVKDLGDLGPRVRKP
jgi:protocatechuate 3,4-dioxygenase beta subunit